MKFAAERHALSRLQAGDVVGGGEDRARRSRGRVRGLHLRYRLGEVSGRRAAPQGSGLDLGACACGDLDHDALDDPRQPRDQLLAADRLRALRGHRRPGGELGQGRRPVHPRREAGRRGAAAGARRPRSGRSRRSTPRRCVASRASIRSRGSIPATISRCRCSPGDHVTDDAGTGFVHTAPGHGREDFEVWMANARALAARGINTVIPYTVDADGSLHRAGARLHRQARHHRQGREGRRQRGRDQGADRRPAC